MWWLLLLLIAIIVLVFIPGVPTTIMLIVLIGVLGFVVLSLVYSYWKDGSGGASPMPCGTCSGSGGNVPPCGQCSNMPCQCAQILPGQTRCPMCPGLLKGNDSGVGGGLVGCGGCGRAFRCPGCLLN